MNLISRNMMKEYCENEFLWYIHPLISQYLPIIAERVFPGKETVVEFLGGLIEKSIETIDASEIQEWILWILRETYTLAASYSEMCEHCLQHIEVIVKEKQVGIGIVWNVDCHTRWIADSFKRILC